MYADVRVAKLRILTRGPGLSLLTSEALLWRGLEVGDHLPLSFETLRILHLLQP